MTRTFTVFAYDIPDDRRRVALAKLLDGIADRVQGSVFEGYVDDRTLMSAMARARELLDPQADRLRVYRLCKTCLKQLVLFGPGEMEEDDSTIII